MHLDLLVVLYVLGSVLWLVVCAVILYWIVKRAVRQGIIEARRAPRREAQRAAEAQRATRRNDGWERARQVGGTSWRA